MLRTIYINIIGRKTDSFTLTETKMCKNIDDAEVKFQAIAYI